MSKRADLTARPTSEQIGRFRALTPAARYDWLASILETTFALAPAPTRARWRAMKAAHSSGFVGVAAGFAEGLAGGDFAWAATFLAGSCVHVAGDLLTQGAAAILAIYRARSSEISIAQRAAVEAVAPGVVRVTLSDRGAPRGVVRWRFDVTIGRSRRVERIVEDE